MVDPAVPRSHAVLPRLRGSRLTAALAVLAIASGRTATADETVRASVGADQGNGHSLTPAQSADGRVLAFESDADDLVTGDTNGTRDIFVRDRETGTTTRVSVDSSGTQANGGSAFAAISANGRYVAFQSDATDLVTGDGNGVTDVFVHDRKTGETTRASVDSFGAEASGASGSPAISRDGRIVAFVSTATDLVPGDTNGVADVFVHDRKKGVTTRASIHSSGAEASASSHGASVSNDGRWVAFSSTSPNLVAADGNAAEDVFLRDLKKGVTTRVSVDATGDDANGASYEAVLSANGRHVAFLSDASDLVTDDGNGALDAFVRDRKKGVTTRASVDSAGIEANASSWGVAISASGRYVAIETAATNLVPADGNAVRDIVLHDRKKGVTTRVSVDSAAAEGSGDCFDPRVSSNGRFVTFLTAATDLVSGDTNAGSDVLVHDRKHGTTTRESVSGPGEEATDVSGEASLSANGRYVAFRSAADDLVPEDGNGKEDVFVFDREAGTTWRASVDSSGGEASDHSAQPAVSANGRYVAFRSAATDLVPSDGNASPDVFVHDRKKGLTSRVSVDSLGAEGNGESSEPTISEDGRYVAFASAASNLVAGDTNGLQDIFVHDRKKGLTTRVSVDSTGGEADFGSFSPSISGNGRHVAFASIATNLVAGGTTGNDHAFVHDRKKGVTTLVSVDSAGTESDGFESERPVISADGRYVAYSSFSTNLVPGDTNGAIDVFLHDLQTGVTSLVSVDAAGGPADMHSRQPALSPDGRYVAFSSVATDLVAGDTNASEDIFVRDRKKGVTTRVSVDSIGTEVTGNSERPTISKKGRQIAFQSDATDLVAGDANAVRDVFLHERD